MDYLFYGHKSFKKMYQQTIKNITYHFSDLKTLMAKATPRRSGDELAGVSAKSAQERVAAQMALADIPLKIFLTEHLIPYEIDEVTRLIIDAPPSEGQ